MEIKKSKGKVSISIILTGIIAIGIGVLFLKFFLSSSENVKSAASCAGMLKGIASLIADKAGLVIC